MNEIYRLENYQALGFEYQPYIVQPCRGSLFKLYVPLKTNREPWPTTHKTAKLAKNYFQTKYKKIGQVPAKWVKGE